MKNKETADAVLKAMREICRQRGLCCATTEEIVAHMRPAAKTTASSSGNGR